MVNYAKIQHHIDRGLGIAAQKLGQPFNVFRTIATSVGDFPDGWSKISSNVPIFRRRIKDTKLESALLASGTMWYQVIGNMEPYLLGDIFMQNDPAYAPGISYGAGATLISGTIQFNAFALAWHAPVNEPVGARLDRRAKIYRPSLIPAAMSDGSSYWKSTHDNDTPLVLINGTFEFGRSGDTGSYIPCGFASTHRVMKEILFPPKVPGSLDAVRFYCYLPPLSGYEPSEGDAIITEDGARYVVVHPYNQESGVVGAQLLVERMISQST